MHFKVSFFSNMRYFSDSSLNKNILDCVNFCLLNVGDESPTLDKKTKQKMQFLAELEKWGENGSFFQKQSETCKSRKRSC